MSEGREPSEQRDDTGDGPALESSQRFESAVPNLDALLGGALLRGTSRTAVGPPGSGNTVLAQQIAFMGTRQGEALLTGLTSPLNVGAAACPSWPTTEGRA